MTRRNGCITVIFNGFAFILTGSAGLGSQAVTLTSQGRSTATIVIPDVPLASERFAAEELATYLKKISRAEIPIVADSSRPAGTLITVGATRDVPAQLLADLDVEECVIQTHGSDRLMIVGGRKPPVKDPAGNNWVRDRGTLYGVYEFLHMLGVRWYDPSPLGEVVPSVSTIQIDRIAYRHKPPFPFRSGFNGLWAVRNRYCGNTWGGPEWGGIWYEWLAHMYQYVVPQDYFKTKPEWFPLIDGKRTTTGQLCISNPELVERFAEWVLGFYRQNPQTEVVGIEANDGSNWCQCEACRRLDDPNLLTPYREVSMSSRVTAFNTAVARKVAEKNPNAIVGWYIYNDHSEVPPGLTSLPANLHGRICPYSAYCNFAEPIETGQSGQNRAMRAVFEGYGKLLKHMSTYEYWSGYDWFGPMPIRKTIAANIRYYHKLKLDGCYQLGPQHWATQGFNYWMAGRLLWDPTQDDDALLDDYCRNFFGKAGRVVKQYHLRLEKAVADSRMAVMSGGAYIEPIFTTQVLTDAQRLLDEAMAAAQDETVKARVRRLQTGIEFTQRATTMKRLENEGDFEGALGVGRGLVAWMEAIHPGKKVLGAATDRYAQEIRKLAEAGRISEATGKAAEQQRYFDNIDKGQYIFAPMDSEPGGHLTERIAKLADNVRDFGRVLALCDMVCPIPREWRFRTDPKTEGEKNGWFKSSLDDTGWEMLPTGVWWEDAGHPGYDGAAWYRMKVRIPESFRGRPVQLFFGAVDGDATIYVNDDLAGRHLLGKDGKGWDEAFIVDVSKRIRFGEDNAFVVLVSDETGYSGIWKPVKLLSPRSVPSTQAQSRIPLKRDDHTLLLVDFNNPVAGWMANEKYGEGAFPGQGDQNRAAWFDAPTTPQTGIRIGVALPVDGTIECWVRPTGVQRSHATLVTVGTVGNTKINLFLGRDNIPRASIVRKDGSETIVGRAVLPDGVWTHVAITWGKDARLRLCLDGQLDAESEKSGPPYACAGDALYVGCQPWYVKDAPDHTAWYTDLNFRGLIDDLRVSGIRRETLDVAGSPAVSPS